MFGPYMQENDIKMMDSFFESFKPKTVLEWGAGGSTIEFPKKHKFIEWWWSIEHDDKWLAKIQNDLSDAVAVYFFPTGYVSNNVTKTLIKEADFIIVDGIEREACLQFAKNFCKDDALVFLHDADRPQYQKHFDQFPYHRQLTQGRVPYDSKIPGFYKRDGLRIFWKSKELEGDICHLPSPEGRSL